jgi:hypothetical protein
MDIQPSHRSKGCLGSLENSRPIWMPMHPVRLDTKTRNNIIFLSIRASKAGHRMTRNCRFCFS